MPSFDTSGATVQTPFGKNQFLRSTKGVKYESYMCAKSAVPDETVDGNTVKVLQPGEVMALIDTGADAGKVGPFQAAGTAEVQTLTESGTISGGTYTITLLGVTTADIAFDATAAEVQAAIELVAPAQVVVTGGPIDSTPLTLTYLNNGDVAQATGDATNLTGSTPGITPATTTPGVAGATDGREDTDNIVGINSTFLPWQLEHRDVEVAVVYDASVVQAWCFERDTAGARQALGNTTRDALIALAGTRLIRFA